MTLGKLMRASVLPLFLVGIAALAAIPTSDAGSYKTSSYKKDIVDTAVSAGSFSTLVPPVQTAGLVDTLKGDGRLCGWDNGLLHDSFDGFGARF
jgi:hypothetical protein